MKRLIFVLLLLGCASKEPTPQQIAPEQVVQLPDSAKVQTASLVVTDTSITRCQATTLKGTQCKRTAKAGSKYCWQHQR